MGALIQPRALCSWIIRVETDEYDSQTDAISWAGMVGENAITPGRVASISAERGYFYLPAVITGT